MSRPNPALVLILGLVAAASPATLTASALATPSTARGHISVAQVMNMIETAPQDRMAQQILTAYLAGVGETASVMAGMGDATCRTALSLSADHVRRALAVIASRNEAETPATRVIVRDMLDRAGCHRP